MTNSNRFLRHLAENPRCFICGAIEGNVEHIFRSCPVAIVMWKKYSWLNNEDIFGKPFTEWIEHNLKIRKSNLGGRLVCSFCSNSLVAMEVGKQQMLW